MFLAVRRVAADDDAAGVGRGYVYECNVTRNAATRRPALGRFKHEAAAVDGPRRTVYLTEDDSDGCGLIA